MILGYCMECQKLCVLKKGEQKWGSRECAWYPRAHENPETGKLCSGDKQEIK